MALAVLLKYRMRHPKRENLSLSPSWLPWPHADVGSTVLGAFVSVLEMFKQCGIWLPFSKLAVLLQVSMRREGCTVQTPVGDSQNQSVILLLLYKSACSRNEIAEIFIICPVHTVLMHFWGQSHLFFLYLNVVFGVDLLKSKLPGQRMLYFYKLWNTLRQNEILFCPTYKAKTKTKPTTGFVISLLWVLLHQRLFTLARNMNTAVQAEEGKEETQALHVYFKRHKSWRATPAACMSLQKRLFFPFLVLFIYLHKVSPWKWPQAGVPAGVKFLSRHAT